MCLFPTIIENPRYKKAIPDDARLRAIKVPCGRCIECRKREANDWRQRIIEERKAQRSPGYFITLTVSDEALARYPGTPENEIMADLITKWRKRLYKKKLKEKHWFVTEKGQEYTERIHAHGLIWTDDDIEDIGEAWQAGWFDVGKKGVSERSISYIVKYMTKADEKHNEFKSKVFASKGIGKAFVKKHQSELRRSKEPMYRLPNGAKIALSAYYEKMIFSNEERECRRLEKMDRRKLYIKGIEYDMTDRDRVRAWVRKMEAEQKSQKKCYRPRKKTKEKFGSLEKWNYLCNARKEVTYEGIRGITEFGEIASRGGAGAMETYSSSMADRV